jgi:MYXO-CTERM domain-containing protein
METPDAPPVDRPPADLPGDRSLPEAGDTPDSNAPEVEAGGDLAIDRTVDLPGDAPSETPGEAGQDSPIDRPKPVDAPRDAGADAADANDDEGEPGPDLRARGGACVCSAGDGDVASQTLFLAILLGIAIARRRR